MNVLIIEDDHHLAGMLRTQLVSAGHHVEIAGDSATAISAITRTSFNVAFLDLQLGIEAGLDLIEPMVARWPQLQVVVITAYATLSSALAAFRAGACDYLPKPFTPEQLRNTLNRLAQNSSKSMANDPIAPLPQTPLRQAESRNPEMRRVLALARDVADSDATVLLGGETGTGKSSLARAIHQLSNRGAKPFSTVSCPSLSNQLLESELFGHVKGAFTGAHTDAPGRIAVSEGGTLFLDEIGDLPMALQPKLLRFLQDRSYERVGDTHTRQANVRLITATHVDLKRAVTEKRFREDLLYRINVIEITLPPLRQRREDIPALAMQILSETKSDSSIHGFTVEAMSMLQNHNWPGNIRELQNVVTRAALICTGNQIDAEHLPTLVSTDREPSLGDPVSFEQIEAAHLRRLLGWTQSLREAARVLGIDAGTLWRKRKRYKL